MIFDHIWLLFDIEVQRLVRVNISDILYYMFGNKLTY